MSASQPKGEGVRFLLFRWGADRPALVASVAKDTGFALELVEEVLERVFEFLGKQDKEPLRRVVQKLYRADRDASPFAFHVALTSALRADLEALPAPVAVDALLSLAEVFRVCVQFQTERADIALQHAAQNRTVELERALASLSAAQQTLLQQARLKAMGSLADGVAHDVNNALNAVLLRTMLLMKQADERSKTHLQSIETVVRGAAATVQRLQEFARRREGRSRAACDPGVVVRDAVALTRQQWTHRAQLEGDFIDVRIEGEGSPVQADPGELRAIVVDLVLNAIEAITGNGVIEVFIREVDDRVEIEVADSGPGILAEHLQKIFEPFFTTRGPRSSGLGLAMAWGVMDRLGGQIRAENRPQGGASFTLSIPRAEVSMPTFRVPDGSGARRILLVDDDADGRETLQQLLVLRGYHVDVAPDGKEALALYRVDLHDAVLCDVSMPKMNGLDLARAVRQRAPTARIALLTGWDAGIVQGADTGVVDAVFQKPIAIEALEAFLSAPLSGGETRSAGQR